MNNTSKLLKLAFAVCALFLASGLGAEIPAGYYTALKGKSEAALKTATCQIINPHTKVSSYSALPSYFQKTDVYPNSTRWWDMYSDIPLYAPSFSGLNREHSLPKSWWGGSESTPAYTDLNHLYPSEAKANQAKSNYPLGIVTGTPTFQNGVVKVGNGVNSGGAKYVFEPADEYKGDFARTYFYMVTCYQDLSWKYTYMCKNGTYPSLQDWAISMLLKWHRNDPVSQKELDRNDAVYKIQNNRNPFIDFPELAEYIWGDKKGQPFNPDTETPPTGKAILITPSNGMYLDFNQTAINHSSTAQLQFRGENLTGYLELNLSRAANTDSEYFSLSTSTVQSKDANRQDGSWITVTYKPTALGKHTAQLIITEGGLQEGSRIVQLSGECLAEPTLSKLTATAATDVNADSFTANWDVPTNEVIDYYMVTLKHYRGNDVVTEELPAESNSLVVDNFAGDDYCTYSVRSSRLGMYSDESNVITVTNPASIGAVETDVPFAVQTFDGGIIRIRCSEKLYNLRVYDLAGREIKLIAEITDFMEFTMPAGAYLVTVDGHRTPVKLIVR